jgi:hypothetical protein
MKIDGRCHCGDITFEAEVDPDAPHICRCTDCQTLSGSAFRMNILASAEHFVLRGTLLLRFARQHREKAFVSQRRTRAHRSLRFASGVAML